MQVSGTSMGSTITSLVKTEGIPAFWKGIAFAWGREGSYASIKLGAYAPVRDALGAGGSDAPFYMKFLAGAITGGVGSVIGNPFDVMKTLAQANKGKSVPLGDLVGSMYRDQGIAGFYRGVGANIARACVLNATKMACYDISKGCKYSYRSRCFCTVVYSTFVPGYLQSDTKPFSTKYLFKSRCPLLDLIHSLIFIFNLEPLYY